MDVWSHEHDSRNRWPRLATQLIARQEVESKENDYRKKPG